MATITQNPTIVHHKHHRQSPANGYIGNGKLPPNGRLLGEQTTQTGGENCDISNEIRVARDLAKDIVHYVSKHKVPKPASSHALTMRRTVDEMLERHQILFNGMVKRLEFTENCGKQTFRNVAGEMFSDGKINWGRVVSLFAFGGRVAKHFADKNKLNNLDRFADILGEYVSERLAPWIHEHGGWDAFDEYFPARSTMEDRLWQGLLVTALGFGALATMVAVK